MEDGSVLHNNSFENNLDKIIPFYITNKKQQTTKFDYIKEMKNEQNLFVDKEDIEDISFIISELNNAIQINLDNVEDNYIGCKEILSILKKPKHAKIVKYKAKKVPFKNLSKPKKISLKGRVLSDMPSNDTQSSSNHYTTGTISIVSINSANNKNNNIRILAKNKV